MVKNSPFSPRKRPKHLDLAKRAKTELSATFRKRVLSPDEKKSWGREGCPRCLVCIMKKKCEFLLTRVESGPGGAPRRSKMLLYL